MPRVALSKVEVHSLRAQAVKVGKELYVKGGFDSVSFRGVASALGFSTGGLYRYFPEGRDEILAAIRTGGFNELTDLQWEACRGTDDPVQALQNIGDSYIQFADDRPAAFYLMFVDLGGEWECFAHLEEAIGKAWGPLEETLSVAAERGLLEGEPKVLARTFYAATLGLLAVHLSEESDPLLSLENLRTSLFTQLIRGATPLSRLKENE